MLDMSWWLDAWQEAVNCMLIMKQTVVQSNVNKSTVVESISARQKEAISIVKGGIFVEAHLLSPNHRSLLGITYPLRPRQSFQSNQSRDARTKTVKPATQFWCGDLARAPAIHRKKRGVPLVT